MDQLLAYVELDHQPVVNVINIERRPGKEDLFCTSETAITMCSEAAGGPNTGSFPYDVTQVTRHLATKDFATQATLGTFVDLVVRIDAAEERSIQNGPNTGSPYLMVSGGDMDGQ